MQADSGDISINGDFSGFQKDKIAGYLQETEFYPWLTGIENLKSMLNLDECDIYKYKSLFFSLEIHQLIFKKYETYSETMKKRFALAFLILQNKDFMVLDEPLLDLEPNCSQYIISLLKSQAKKGKGIIILSKDLETLEQFSDEIYILKDGKATRHVLQKEQILTYQLVFANITARKKAELLIKTDFEVIEPNKLEIKLSKAQDIDSIIKDLANTALKEVKKEEPSCDNLSMKNAFI